MKHTNYRKDPKSKPATRATFHVERSKYSPKTDEGNPSWRREQKLSRQLRETLDTLTGSDWQGFHGR